jgi:hypothetical protein
MGGRQRIGEAHGGRICLGAACAVEWVSLP